MHSEKVIFLAVHFVLVDYVSLSFGLFIVRYSKTVNIALAVQDVSALSQTPLSLKIGVRIKSDAIGNTSVPKKETSIERAGRSSAVK